MEGTGNRCGPEKCRDKSSDARWGLVPQEGHKLEGMGQGTEREREGRSQKKGVKQSG